MVDFIENEKFVLILRVVLLNDVKHLIRFQPVNHLDPIKVHHDFAAGAAGHVVDGVGLEGSLDGPVCGEERQHHVEARLGCSL